MADHFKKPGHSSAPEPSLRQSESYVALGTAVLINPFIDALVAFIVICQMAISLVADELFIEFLQVIFPKIKDILPGCGKSMRGYIIKAYEQRKVKVKDILARSKSKIHFSFDLWTSPNHLALIGIIAHFVDDHGRNQSVSCSYHGSSFYSRISHLLHHASLHGIQRVKALSSVQAFKRRTLCKDAWCYR